MLYHKTVNLYTRHTDVPHTYSRAYFISAKCRGTRPVSEGAVVQQLKLPTPYLFGLS
jgi:hypothetical protein